MAQQKPIEDYIDNDLPTTSNDEFELENGKTIGSGMTGKVFLLQVCENNNYLAMKRFITTTDSKRSREKAIKMFKAEVYILKHCQHQNVMSIFSTYRFTDSLCILMPYMSGGNLIKNIRGLTLPQTEKYFFQITDAVKYLHEKKIVHLDIKPNNILISGQDEAVLTDFGLSKVMLSQDVEVVVNCGTRGYLAPEVDFTSTSKVNPFKVDVYALGMTLWTMIVKKGPKQYKDHLQLVTDENVTPSLQHILQSLLQEDPSLRPTASKVAEAKTQLQQLAG